MRENVFRNEEQRLREKALSLTHIGKEIMLNSVQRRLDSRTIILERKEKMKAMKTKILLK